MFHGPGPIRARWLRKPSGRDSSGDGAGARVEVHAAQLPAGAQLLRPPRQRDPG